MLGLSLGLSLGNPIAAASGPYVFANSEAEALVAAMTVEPDDARKALIDTLIGGLKADGVWTAMAANAESRLYVLAAHDAQAARLDWLNPSRSARLVNAPVFAIDKGYQTDGAASYVDLVATLDSFGQDSLSFGFWSLTSDRLGGSLAGAFSAQNGTTISPYQSPAAFGMRANQAAITQGGAATDSAGLYVVRRSAAAVANLYKNGASVLASSEASVAPLALSPHLGHLNGSSTFGAMEFAAGLIGPLLTATQITALYNRLNSYLTSIGA